MNAFRTILNLSENKPLLTAIVVNAVFCIFFLCTEELRFSSMDDFFMSAVLEGAYGGQYDVHMYFVNAAYGILLKPLYLLFPGICWYIVGQSFFVFISFVAITYCILMTLKPVWSLAVSCLLLSCVLPYFWPIVAFTQCAGALFAAGTLLACQSVLRNRKSLMLTAVFFIIASFIMRKDMFLLGLPTLSAPLVLCSVKAKKLHWAQLVILSAGLLGVCGLHYYNSLLYKDGGYDYYAAYQAPRAFFGDGGFYDTEAAYDELKERGLCGADLRVLRAWYFYDTEAFSLDSLKAKIDIVKRSNYDVNYIKMPVAIAIAISRAFMATSPWCWILIAAIFILFCKTRWRFLPWASLCLIMLSYTYLLMVNRVAGHVELGIWIYAIVFLLPFVKTCPGVLERKESYVIAVMVIFALGTVGIHLWLAVPKISSQGLISEKEQTSEWKNFEEYAHAHPNDVFFLAFEPYKRYAAAYRSPYRSFAPGSWDNIHSLGYWNLNLPAIKTELQKRGVLNPMKDVVQPNVYVIEADQPILPYYFEEHYHQKLHADTVRFFGNITLLKYRLEVSDE